MTHLFHQVLALFALTATLHAVAPAGQRQQLSSPDQVPEGLAKSDWQSIREAYEAGRHAFQPTESGWQARNPGQQWLTTFDRRGFVAQPEGAAWQWGLELKSYGIEGRERAIGGVPAVRAEGQRLSYQWDESLQEWFVNDRRGLEHGFTIAQRPEGLAESPLAFTLGVRGGLRPDISKDALGVAFQNNFGGTMLTYAGLKVWDADGKVLAARFVAAGDDLRLLVEERGARYPITIDPVAQQAYLKASNTGASDNFGCSVAVSGDTVVVGAWGESSSARGVNGNQADNSASESGAAYVFVRSGTTWTQQAYLKASNTGIQDKFGYSVAASGDTVVVGAYWQSLQISGAAYVFVRSGTTWTQQAYLKASNTGEFDEFGYSVAVSGDTVVVGAPGEDSSATGVNSNQADNSAGASGAAYVFARSGTTWTQQAYLKASNTGLSDFFGYSVAVSGNTVVVGASEEDSSATGVNGNGADNSAVDSGAAYVFTRNGIAWTQQAYLKASNTERGDEFGRSVGVSGDTVVVGAPYRGDSVLEGAAYVFARTGATWMQQTYLKKSATGDQFGYSVAVSGDTVVVGVPYRSHNSTANGAAYVFLRSGTTWTEQAYLAASNRGSYDYFGYSVAVSGDTVLVGASEEDSSAVGVNGNGADNSAAASGAAYVFTVMADPPVPTRILGLSGNLAFGSVGAGTSMTATLTIINSGNSALNVTGINYPSGFSGAWSGAIAAWSSQNVTVMFSPTAVQAYSGTVTVASDKTSGTNTISCSGTGAEVNAAFADWLYSEYEYISYQGDVPQEISAPINGISSIALGHSTVALKNDGGLITWGNNSGQATVPAGLSGVTAIAMGFSHTVALKNDGTVVAWDGGGNIFGAATVPAGLSGVTAIAAGDGHTVALKSDGTVVAWGYNSHGQTTVPTGLTGVKAIAAGEDYTVALKNDGTVVAWGNNASDQLTGAAGLSGVTAIAAGDSHTVALKSDGTVVAWGYNYWGQTRVPAGLTGVKAIAAADDHTVALKSDGTVVAWGFNYYGQTTVPAGLTGVKAIAAGGHRTAALKNDGTVVVWGYDLDGKARRLSGLAGVTAFAAGVHHRVALKNNGTVVAWGGNSYGQTRVPAGLTGVKAIAAGLWHSLALKNDGTVVAWGGNMFGQATVPAGLSGVTAIAAGDNHTVALKSDGTVVAWGANSGGESTVPAGLSGVTAIAGGALHTMALKNNGTVVAWGNNGFGQATVPAGLSGVKAITAGDSHSVALKNDGTVVAWGDNSDGQSTVPAGLSGVTAIAAGDYHTVALKSDGAVVAWGSDYAGLMTLRSTGKVTAIAAAYNLSFYRISPSRHLSLAGNLTFGSVGKGDSKTATLTITNSGNSVLNVTSITYPSGFSGAWTGTIAAGSSQNVTVAFRPTAVQAYSGTVMVTSNKTGGANTIACSGTGTADTTKPSLAISTPAASARLTSVPIRFSGNATDNVSVSRVQFSTNNGTTWGNATLGTGTVSRAWTANVTVPAGPASVLFRAVDSSNNIGANVARNVTYGVPATLSITATGGSVTTGFSGNSTRDLNVSYTVTATPVAGKIFRRWLANGVTVSRSATYTFKMTTGLKLAPEFIVNPFPAVAGEFNGLIGAGVLGTGTTAGASFVAQNGFLAATVGGNGSLSGSLRLDGLATPFSGQLDGFGETTLSVARTSKPTAAVKMKLALAAPGRLTGNVTVGGVALPFDALPGIYTGANGSVSPLNGRRYNVALKPQVGGPAGYGYGSLTFSANGTGTLTGKLADGTPFSAKARSVDDLLGNWMVPIQVPLYTSTGILWGELALPKTTPAATVADVTGELAWIRPANPAAASFKLGFNTAVDALGARYLPVAGKSLLTGASATAPFHLTVNGVGRTPATLTANGTWTAANVSTLTAPPAGTTWTFTPATGLFTGNFTYGSGATTSTQRFDGLLITKPLLGGTGTIRGAGFHTGGNSSASVLLSK